MVTEKFFENVTDKGFENGEMKEVLEVDWYFEGTF